jgi:hypothetical protein
MTGIEERSAARIRLATTTEPEEQAPRAAATHKHHRSENFKYMERSAFSVLFAHSISLLSGDPDEVVDLLCSGKLAEHYAGLPVGENHGR